MSSLALEASGLSKAYKIGKTRQQVLKNVDFTAHHGQMTMVMGPSGSGKSTLIAALSGLMRPDEGKVMAMGESLWAKSDGKIDKFRLDHCGFIFQGFNLFPSLDAVAQVAQILQVLRHQQARIAHTGGRRAGIGWSRRAPAPKAR